MTDTTPKARRRRAAAKVPGLRHGTVAGVERYAPSSGVVCPAGRGAAPLALAATVIFACVGVLMISLAVTAARLDLLIAGTLAFVLSGVGTVALLPRLFGPPPGILLVPEGVFCRMPVGTAWLPWDTIAGVHLGERKEQQWVAFGLHPGDDGAGRAVLTGPARWLRRANHRFGMDAGFSAQGLALPPEDVVALLVRLLGDPGLRAQLRDPSILATLRRPDPSAWRRW